MILGRRKLLVGAAITAVDSACRRRGWDNGRSEGGNEASILAPVPSGPMCAGSTVPAQTRPPLHPEGLRRFVDPLPIPPIAKADGSRPDPGGSVSQLPYYRIPMREAPVRVHQDVPETRVWSYGGSFPGPTFETRTGQGLLVEWVNELPKTHFLPIDHALCGAGADTLDVRTVVHVHGARVKSESDGYPEDWYPPGKSALFHYPNKQDAATLWYHDHAMGIERLNQYAGLLGVFLIRDGVEDALHLPRGPYEIPLVLCDRDFDAEGQLVYPTSGDPSAPWVPEFYGNFHLVNGKIFPYLEVEPRRYRFRVVNAANARFYDLTLSNGQSFDQIGTDQGLLRAPVSIQQLTLGPAERGDVTIDFSRAKGETVVLQSKPFELLQFRVTNGAAKREPLPAVLRPMTRTPVTPAVHRRTLTLNDYQDPKTQAMLMLLDGKRWRDPVTEKPTLGSVEIWELVNTTEDTHPIHLHLVRFQILERQAFDADFYQSHGTMKLAGAPQPPGPEEDGWKDTVRALPGFITRIIVSFDGYPGRYAWHCHILEHAANEMMRPFEVVDSGS